MYLIYHVISKIRGNEKNVQLNNFGIGLSLLGIVSYSILFIDFGTRTLAHDKKMSWRAKHLTLYWWIRWSADSALLLYHWLFNWRYVKSTFRLPVLKKSAEFHNKKLDKIIKQREDQHVLFSPQELEDFAREMGELKKTQVRHESYARVIEVIVLLLVAASSYTEVYVSWIKTANFL